MITSTIPAGSPIPERRPGDSAQIYNRAMVPAHSFGRALDTAPASSAQQIALWRSMTPQQKAQLVASLSRATRQLAEAGIAARYPQAAARERFLRLAILQLGRELAVQVYPDAEPLAP